MRRCNQFLLRWDIPNYRLVSGQYSTGLEKSALDIYATKLVLCEDSYDCVGKGCAACIR